MSRGLLLALSRKGSIQRSVGSFAHSASIDALFELFKSSYDGISVKVTQANQLFALKYTYLGFNEGVLTSQLISSFTHRFNGTIENTTSTAYLHNAVSGRYGYFADSVTTTSNAVGKLTFEYLSPAVISQVVVVGNKVKLTIDKQVYMGITVENLVNRGLKWKI